MRTVLRSDAVTESKGKQYSVNPVTEKALTSQFIRHASETADFYTAGDADTDNSITFHELKG